MGLSYPPPTPTYFTLPQVSFVLAHPFPLKHLIPHVIMDDPNLEESCYKRIQTNYSLKQV